LHKGIGEAKVFYGTYAVTVTVAAAIVLIPHAPLGLITTAVQALAGILLPSATVFLVLLCNDRAVLGPWVNKTWLNVLATFIVSVLLLLSLVLVVSTVIPSIDVTKLVIGLGSAMAVVLAVGGVWRWFSQIDAVHLPELSRAEKESWRMPGLALLERPTWSMGRRVAMLTLSAYLVLSIVVLGVKAVELALGH
jgi:hypothetical protein